MQDLEQLHLDFVALGDVAAAAPEELWTVPGHLAFSTFFSLMFSATARVSCAVGSVLNGITDCHLEEIQPCLLLLQQPLGQAQLLLVSLMRPCASPCSALLCCSQLRKVYRVLPAALARDQPGAAAETQECFGRLPAFDLKLLARLDDQAAVGVSKSMSKVYTLPQRSDWLCPPLQAHGRDAATLLRVSVISSSATASPRAGQRSAELTTRGSSELEKHLEQATDIPGKFILIDRLCRQPAFPIVWNSHVTLRPVLCCAFAAAQRRELLARMSHRNIAVHTGQAQAQQPVSLGWLGHGWQRMHEAWAFLLALVHVREQQLRLGLQFVVCFWAVMALQMSTASYDALLGRPIWSVSFSAAAGRR